VAVGEGSKLEVAQSGDASTRILLPPLAPQDALAQVEQPPMLEHAASLERQWPILHRHLHVQPIRKHGEPRPKLRPTPAT
jgi:hypothetical protein